MIINVYCSSCKEPDILVQLQFSQQFFEKIQLPNFIKILPVRAVLLHADRQTDRQTDGEI